MDTYVILNNEGIIVNIIKSSASYAQKHGCLPAYEGAALGDHYEPPAATPTAQETTVWDELDAAYQEGVNSAYDS